MTGAMETDSFWARLRRRKVVQWGIVYIAGAWGLLQGLAYITGTFDWPRQLQQISTIALLVGLPIVLVIAWYHGDRGQQRVSATELIIIALLFLLGGGIFWRYERASLASPSPASLATAPAAAPVPAADSRPSIAVMPFVNMSPDKDNEYFSDGISEELLNVLVRVDGIGVASRTSSFAFKGREVGTSEIARELKVNHILEGSVRKSGTRVRITAQLIDATNDRHLWSETYDRELTDIFAIQDEIANAIVAALRGSLGTGTSERAVTVRADTQNLKAYDLYLKARELFIERKDIAESIRLFEKVVEMDPKFARGWEGLAAVYSIAKSWGVMDRDYTELAGSAARRALDLDPSLSMPYAALALVLEDKQPVDWDASLALFDRAIVADPKNATAYLWRSINWANLGFFKQAIADQDRCLAIDPGYRNCLRWKAESLLKSGNADQGLALFEQGVETGFVTNRAASFVPLLVSRGNRMAAALLLDQMGTSPELSRILLAALEHPEATRRPDADAIVRRYALDAASRYYGTIGPSLTYMWLGAYDQAATAEGLDTDDVLAWEPLPAGFRKSPGFKKALERFGVPAYWRRHGYPPQCRAAGQDDFMCD
jgi:TolB-like protein/Tfp pilus assembly protein PilF